MKILILFYYVAYLFTKILAKSPDNDLKIAKIIGLVNNIYSDDDLSDAWGGRYGRIYPRTQTEMVLKPSSDEDAAQQTLRNEVEELTADEPSYRRIGPENIRLIINGILSTKPRVNQNYHIETQRFKKNNEDKKKIEEESITLNNENARQGQTQKEILEFVLLKENERIKRMKQEDRKEKSLRSKKNIRLSKDNRRPKDVDKTSNKKKEHTREHEDTDKKKWSKEKDKTTNKKHTREDGDTSKKKSSVKNKSKKKDAIKKESDLRDKKINRDRKESHSKNLPKKTKTENGKKRKSKNENDKKRKEKNENNSNSWKTTDRQRNLKSDKLEKDWNRRHRQYDDFDNNEFENDIGIMDNASDMNMEEEWAKRHPIETENSKIQNSFERN